MKQYIPYLIGGMFGILKAAVFIAAMEYGRAEGKTEVVQHCAAYKAYALDGTQKLLCSLVTTPELPASTLTAEQYSKENKDKHKKDRK